MKESELKLLIAQSEAKVRDYMLSSNGQATDMWLNILDKLEDKKAKGQFTKDPKREDE